MGDPGNHDLLDLHRRLLAGDRTTFSTIAERLLGPLQARLSCRDEVLRHDAVVDALMDYAKHPHKFDAAKRSLFGYLHMAAAADLKNALRGRARRQRHETAAGEMFGKTVEVDADPGKFLETAESAAKGQADFRRLLATLDPADRPVAGSMRDGVRSYAAYADAMGLLGLPVAEQRRLIKRAKDRVVKARQRLKRE